MKKALIAFSLVALAVACGRETIAPGNVSNSPTLPEATYDYNPEDLPRHFHTNVGFTNNDLPTLGRVLFYDPQLSFNNTTSCGSCHHQSRAFADPVRFSQGFKTHTTERNSMAIFNMDLEERFFWDGRETQLEEQVLMPIKNHVEMGIEDINKLANKLSQVEYYPPLFEKAFGTSAINEKRIAEALEAFLNSMLSYRSPFDQGQEIDFANFSPLEEEGRRLFFNELHCSSCHTGDNFTGWSSEAANIGLEKDYKDPGVQSLSGSDHDEGMFKIPSLRNVALTGPYMHDGRFTTLEEVIDHYDHGIVNHPNLDWRLQDIEFSGVPIVLFNDILGSSIFVNPESANIKPRKLNLTQGQKAALVAFLGTLTDRAYTTDPRFSDPFRVK